MRYMLRMSGETDYPSVLMAWRCFRRTVSEIHGLQSLPGFFVAEQGELQEHVAVDEDDPDYDWTPAEFNYDWRNQQLTFEEKGHTVTVNVARAMYGDSFKFEHRAGGQDACVSLFVCEREQYLTIDDGAPERDRWLAAAAHLMTGEERMRAELANLYGYGERELAAASYFRRLAGRGRDLSSVARELEDRMYEAGDVRVIEALAVALCKHWVKAGDMTRLGRALGGKYTADDFQQALRRARYDITPALELLLRRGATEVLATHMARKDNRWPVGQIFDGLCQAGHASTSVPRLVYLVDGRGALRVGETVRALAKSLTDGRRAGRRGAVTALARLAREHARVLGPAMAPLERALEDPDREVRRGASTALALRHLYSKAPHWKGLDALLSSRRPLNRAAAGAALLQVAREDGPATSAPNRHALLRRLASLAGGGARDLGDRAADQLLRCAADWPDAGFDAAAALFKQLGPQAAAERLRAFALGSAGDARWVHAQLERLAPLRDEPLEQALATSAAAMGDGYCAICAEVPRRKVYWSEFDIPDAIQALAIAQKPVGNFRCPECGAFYSVLYTLEIEDVCTFDEEWTVERLSPDRSLGGRLEGDLLEQAKDHFAGWVEAYEALLELDDPALAGDAPWALVERWLSRDEPQRVATLLADARPEIRGAALTAVEELVSDPRVRAPLLPALVGLLTDGEASLRARAAAMVAAHYLERRAHKKLQLMLDAADDVVLESAVRVMLDGGVDLRRFEPLLPWITENAAGPRQELRWQCQRALREGLAQGVAVDAALAAFEALLQQEDLTLRREGLSCLTEADELGRFDVLELLARSLADPDLRWEANHNLEKLMFQGRDISLAVPALAAVLAQPGARYEESLVQTLGRAAHRGIDVSPALAAMGALCRTGGLTDQAMEVLGAAHEQGLDLADVEDDLRAVLRRRLDPYLWEAAAQMLSDRYLARGDWDAMQGLLLHRRHYARYIACDKVTDHARAGSDITIATPHLVANLKHDSANVRERAQAALTAWAANRE